ncbi:MAG: hypothetical protein KDI14_18850 [Halioglobus sp.]|nr:hypothetical protein [Halioglobus sp.]
MTTIKKLLPAALALIFTGSAVADDLTDAAQGLCETVKSCVLEQLAGQDLPPGMEANMGPMLDNMCAKMRSQVQEVPTGHELYEPAVGCMRSMESLTCEQLQNADSVTTPECTEYERLAKEAGVVK